MAAGSSPGDPLALPSPAEGRGGHCELTEQIQSKILRGHSDTVSSCHFCFEDTKILSCSYDRTVKLWDVEKGFPIQVFEEHTAPISECNLTPDDRRCVVSGSDKENAIYVFDSISAAVVAHIRGHHKSTITRCCFDPDNQRVTSVSYDKTINLWDMIT